MSCSEIVIATYIIVDISCSVPPPPPLSIINVILLYACYYDFSIIKKKNNNNNIAYLPTFNISDWHRRETYFRNLCVCVCVRARESGKSSTFLSSVRTGWRPFKHIIHLYNTCDNRAPCYDNNMCYKHPTGLPT